jgi:hypothetical protein
MALMLSFQMLVEQFCSCASFDVCGKCIPQSGAAAEKDLLDIDSDIELWRVVAVSP